MRQSGNPSYDEARRAGNCDSGYSCAYQFNLAWKNESLPLSPERDPKLAFERLFTNGLAGEADVARAKREFYNKSILDFVSDDAVTLQKHLGATDRRKLDEYMTSIRDIERRLTHAHGRDKHHGRLDRLSLGSFDGRGPDGFA